MKSYMNKIKFETESSNTISQSQVWTNIVERIRSSYTPTYDVLYLTAYDRILTPILVCKDLHCRKQDPTGDLE